MRLPHRLPFRALALSLAFAASPALGLAATAVKPHAAVNPPLPSGPQYFFNVRLDPRYQIVGLGPLSPEQAVTANAYCFTYDREGRLQRVEFDRAGVPMPDPYFHAARIDFERSSGVERRWYRDATGQAVINSDGVDGEQLTLNSAGFPIAVTNLNDSGGTMRDSEGVVRTDRRLDRESRVVEGRRVGLLGINIRDHDGFFATRTIYDDQSRPIEYDNFDSSGQPVNDDDGVASVHTSYAQAPDGSLVTETYFDTNGQPTEEKSTGIHQRQSVYDPRGFLLDETYFDADGAPTPDATTGVHEHRLAYDDRGNRTSEEYFGVDGQPRNHRVLGFARVDYRYDAKNRVSEKSYVGDDGLPQVIPGLGAAVVRQEYDDHGNIVHRQFFDGQGNPSPHVQYGVPAIRIHIDGDMTTVTLRDAKDELTRNPINGYASFSYNTLKDRPLTRHNLYFDQHGRRMSWFRIKVIKPHVYALRHDTGMRRNAHWGIVAAGLGALLAMLLALRKASYTERRKVYVPTPLERFLGWLAVFALIEGTLRFIITIYWAWVGYQNGRMGWGIYAIEAVIILFFVYRLPRMRVTMRVLNIRREDIHRLVRDFYTKAQLKPEYRERNDLYRTYPFSVRIAYFANKAHAYLKFRYRHREGRDLLRAFAQFIREQVTTVEAPLRSRAIALYYPCVACAYLILAATAGYVFYTMVTSS
jgi:YD repeat-containing protein